MHLDANQYLRLLIQANFSISAVAKQTIVTTLLIAESAAAAAAATLALLLCWPYTNGLDTLLDFNPISGEFSGVFVFSGPSYWFSEEMFYDYYWRC